MDMSGDMWAAILLALKMVAGLAVSELESEPAVAAAVGKATVSATPYALIVMSHAAWFARPFFGSFGDHKNRGGHTRKLRAQQS